MTPALAQEATTATAETAVKDFSVGSPGAKVKMVEYASFTCPHCATFHETVYPQLKTEYIDTGKVHFTLREVYFDRYGLWAALIARCGGDMKYFGIHDMLFAQQKDWAASEDPMQVVEKLKTIGRAAGLEDAAMDACLNDTANAEALLIQSFVGEAIEGLYVAGEAGSLW
ncbi:MAG: thioredoxin domain-containing protein, partial [Pseudomonadota bacterium]